MSGALNIARFDWYAIKDVREVTNHMLFSFFNLGLMGTRTLTISGKIKLIMPT